MYLKYTVLLSVVPQRYTSSTFICIILEVHNYVAPSLQVCLSRSAPEVILGILLGLL